MNNNENLNENLDQSMIIVDDNKLLDQDPSLIQRKRKYINGINSAVSINNIRIIKLFFLINNGFL